jgi:uncharacterized protein
VSPAVRLEFPDEGGHASFVSAPFPGNLDWMPRRVAAFFQEAMAGREAGAAMYSNGTISNQGAVPQ